MPFPPNRKWIIISIALLLSTGLESYCQNEALIRHGGLINLSGKNLTLGEIREKVKDQTGIYINYNAEISVKAGVYSLHFRNVGIDSCLHALIAGKWLEVKKYSCILYSIVSKGGKEPDYHFLEGMVRNAKGEPLENATVKVEPNGKTVLTNDQGSFKLSSEAGSADVVVTNVGYHSSHVTIFEGQPKDIVMDFQSLEGVVVEAYGSTTRRLETGDIAQMTGKDIQVQPVGNPLAALEGRMPGLVVTQTSGVPGSSMNVQVRGQNSILQGNQPLILIDGVPIPPNNNSLSYIPSGSAYGLPGMSPMDCFSPEDIDSIEVLKDADATAIYGSRGANGVILITTKKGKPGPMIISANLSAGSSRAINTAHLLNSQQYAQMREEALLNDDSTAMDAVTAPDLVLLDTNRYTDFKKMAIGNAALFQNADLGVSGGNKSFTYLFSGSEHRESTPFPGSPGESRLSIFSSLGFHSRSNRFHVQSSTFYGTVDNRLPVFDPTQFIYLAPDAPSPYDPTGGFQFQQKGQPFTNIPANSLNSYHGLTKNFFTHWQLNYHLLKGLTARINGGYNSMVTNETSIEPIAAQDPANDPRGTFFSGATKFNGLIGEPQLEYTRQKGCAKLDLLAGATFEGQHSRHTAVSLSGYTSDASLGQTGPMLTVYTQDSSVLYLYEALFLRARLVLSDKYIFAINGRRDGSSRFGPGHQYGNFGSVSAGWLFQKEKLFSKMDWLSYGKLRTSYGVTGNDQIGDYQYAQSWITGTGGVLSYGGFQGLYPATTDNPQLGWELVHKLEGAMELGVWQDRILFSAAWYRNWTGNQLMYNILPSQTGYPGVIANLPVDVVNTGWEFVLSTNQKFSSGLHWNSSFSLTIPRNRLASFPGLASSAYAGSLEIGKSVNTIKTYQYLGVDKDLGIYQVRDVNKDGVINDNDRVFGGNTDIRAYAGWNNEFSYKGWQFTLFLEARRQNGYDGLIQLYDQGSSPVSPGNLVSELQGNMPVQVLQRWQRPGDDQPVQQFTTATDGTPVTNALNNYVLSDAKLRDASFIRVKTLMLGYSLPRPVLSKWHMRDCLLYLQCQNPLTFTHYPVTDPETQNPRVLPPLRTFEAGIRFNF